ncbi:hypothetical protein HXA34_02965 [Salipaludibacillus agaradhaerens]|uniref:hypothetical protein n=1 Tax=Salipaludibacillus agaradhaerens TaxID=76935 RepID=UPI002151301C|nr:hypothetical protein [Salipaludibacillus agaradhaerens]MCR6105248.1 hypothetical protein [Salipaludibacillus agaradhaerens]MCR6117292.1 hypothetical protein [Salipaludibacillus agaradhaerens]
MIKKYIGYVIIALLVISVFIFIREINALEGKNSKLSEDVLRLEGMVNELTKPENHDIILAVSVVEKYLLVEKVDDIKPFLIDEVYFPAEEEPDREHNPNQINFPNNHYYEWSPEHFGQKLEGFIKDSESIYLYYKTTAFFDENDFVFKYTMKKEEGWKISKIEAVDQKEI